MINLLLLGLWCRTIEKVNYCCKKHVSCHMSPTTTGFASCHKLLLAPFCTKLKCSKSQMAALIY